MHPKLQKESSAPIWIGAILFITILLATLAYDRLSLAHLSHATGTIIDWKLSPPLNQPEKYYTMSLEYQPIYTVAFSTEDGKTHHIELLSFSTHCLRIVLKT